MDHEEGETDEGWGDGGYGEDEFDYDEFIGREFGGETGQNSGWIFGGGPRGRRIQTTILIALVIAFLAWAFRL